MNDNRTTMLVIGSTARLGLLDAMVAAVYYQLSQDQLLTSPQTVIMLATVNYRVSNRSAD